jgi:hypothetical protein
MIQGMKLELVGVQNLKKHIIQFALNMSLLRSDTDESVTQFEKHDDPRILTLHGIIIDGCDEYEKNRRFNSR